VPGCCCYMPLLHNHLMDSCSYVRRNTLLAAKGGCICTPLTSPKSATVAGCAVVDKAPLVAKIAQEVGWEVVWDAALSRGGCAIRRLQLFVKALHHHCPDDPLACLYVDGHLSGETLRQLSHSNF